MAADQEKNDVQAVERSDVHSDQGKQQQIRGEWQDVGSEETMTWKTWVVIFVGQNELGIDGEVLTRAGALIVFRTLLLVLNPSICAQRVTKLTRIFD